MYRRGSHGAPSPSVHAETKIIEEDRWSGKAGRMSCILEPGACNGFIPQSE